MNGKEANAAAILPVLSGVVFSRLIGSSRNLRSADRYELGLHAHGIPGELTEYVLMVSSDLRAPEATRYRGVHRGDDWFVAVEAAAGQIVAQLTPEAAVETPKSPGDDLAAPSINRPS